MQKEIIQPEVKPINVEIGLPFYYKQEYDSGYGDDFVYGKITSNLWVTIHEECDYNGTITCEIQKKPFVSTTERIEYYLGKVYVSNELEFDLAKERFIAYIDSI